MARRFSFASGLHPPAALYIPSLYYIQGLPYAIVMMLSVVMYKRLGISNTQIALWTSLLYLPWVLKPLWAPLIDMRATKRWWIVRSQLLATACTAAAAYGVATGRGSTLTLAAFGALAVVSATHDIAADGFYLVALTPRQQALYSGIRNTAYRLAIITAQGGIVILAGILEFSQPTTRAWGAALAGASCLLALGTIWHSTMLPTCPDDQSTHFSISGGFINALRSFCDRPNIATAIAFLLTFRLGEAQLVRLAPPFLLDSREVGGLAMQTTVLGICYGTFGTCSLLLGGLIGGFIASRFPLSSLLPIYWAAMNLPNLLYLFLAYLQPSNTSVTAGIIAIEQLGYGIGFSGYMLYMLHLSTDPRWQSSHFALCTAFMAVGMLLPGLPAGWIQQHVGYSYFFIWVTICSLPALWLIRRLPYYPNTL